MLIDRVAYIAIVLWWLSYDPQGINKFGRSIMEFQVGILITKWLIFPRIKETLPLMIQMVETFFSTLLFWASLVIFVIAVIVDPNIFVKIISLFALICIFNIAASRITVVKISN